MTRAQRTARACRIAAAALYITAACLAYVHWAYALPGVISAGVFLGVADSYRREEQRQRARHARLHHAARSDAALLAAPSCGARHHLYPETVCTEPAGHYVRDRDSHAGPLIISGRERGGAAWDEPRSAA